MKVQAARIKPLILFAIALCLLFTTPAMANPNATENNTDTSLLVDAEYVQRYKRQNPGLQLIDVRSTNDFQKAHIPGSIHIPLNMVPHKSFLQGEPVVLVNNGAAPEPLLRTCRKLRRKGIQASVLFGGLTRWHDVGGRLTGESKEIIALKEVSPATYYRQRGSRFWKVLYVGDQRPQELDTVLPTAQFTQENELTLKLENSAEPRNLLLVTRRGKGYDRLIKVLQKKGINNVFSLQGGLNAYIKQFRSRKNRSDCKKQREQVRSQCSKDINNKRTGTCTDCRK